MLTATATTAPHPTKPFSMNKTPCFPGAEWFEMCSLSRITLKSIYPSDSQVLASSFQYKLLAGTVLNPETPSPVQHLLAVTFADPITPG